MSTNLKHIMIAAMICLGISGCGESQTAPPADSQSKPAITNSPAPAPQQALPVVAEEKKPDPMIGVYEATMLNIGTNDPQPLHLELKLENRFTAYPQNEANNKLHGTWKIEGTFLICTGITEATKQQMTLKIDPKSLNLVSISQKDTVIPLDQITPSGAKSRNPDSSYV